MTVLTPTPASAWQVVQDETVVLPSGNAATLREVSLLMLFAKGGMPQVFADIAGGEMTGASAGGAAGIDPADMAKMANIIVMAAFVSPEVVARDADASQNQITLAQVSDEDKMFVMGRTMKKLGLNPSAPEVEQGTKSVEGPAAGV